MATTEVFYNGDGSDVTFTIPFEYLEESDVKVSVGGTLKTQDTDYTFSTLTEITFTTAPASGTNNVRIFRDTDINSLRNEFFAGSAIRAQDLNDDFLQTLYTVQEIEDQFVTKTDGEFDTNVDMNGNRITELGDPVDAQDAVTKQYLEDNYFDDDTETILSGESWPNNDTTIATTAAIDNRVDSKIDTAIEGDVLVDGTGLTKSASGGQVTLGIGAGSVDLDRIKAADIIVAGEANPNNDTTIATTAKIDDMIDAAITGDIATDSTGITVTDDGDGTITLGLANIDLDRIKADDVVTLAEQNAGPTTDDDSIFTTSAAAKRFDTLVQTATPTATDYETGKTWLQNDDDQTLKIWNGSTWLDVASGGSFRTQDKVIYVDATGGDDSKTGHRISGPKLTIKGAIADINADISLSTETSDGFDGGSGYTEGDYSSVALTHSSGTGIGTGATANISVNSSGVVTSVTINTASALEEYSIGDVLTAADANLGGGGGSGLLIPIIGGGDGMTVIVAAGVYQEAAPIQIKRRNVSIVGMALRSTIVHPTVATQGDHATGNHALFELNTGSFIQNLTLTGIKANNSGTNTLDSALPDRQGWNFAFYDGCFIAKSPYIQNCTNFSDSEIDNNDLRAHRPRGGTAGDTDSLPTGGGMLIDGSVPATTSPIRSMVADSYTHVGLNGPGILVTNNGYTQITSSYAFFNKYHIKTLNGGQANLAASTSDFGERSLIADGKSTAAIFTSNVDGAASDGDTTFNINEPTAGVGWFGSTQRPAENMLVEVNSVIYPILSATANTDSEGGDGWTVTISRPNSDDRSENLGLNGAITDDAAVSFFLRSQIASSGHTMEYVGSGTNYNALPENGGVPDETRQITELNNGKIWTAITDHNGKFRIGGNQTDDPFFEVDQQLGFVTIPEGSIAFNLLSDETPQLGGNLDVNGNDIVSVSNGDINITPNGTGKIVLDGLNWPTSDGTNGQALTTNASGQLSFTTVTTATPTLDAVTDAGATTDNNITVGEITSTPGVLQSTGSSNMTLKTSGNVQLESNVLIGDSLPTSIHHRLNENGSAVFNDQGSAAGDFRVESDNNTHMLFVNAGADGVGINEPSPTATLDVRGNIRIRDGNNLDFQNDAEDRAVQLNADDCTTSYNATLPPAPGTADQVLTIDSVNGINLELSWADAAGGGATGGGSDQIFHENSTTVTTDYTVGTTLGDTAACNAMSAGPITVNSGVTVTVNSGSRWVIV